MAEFQFVCRTIDIQHSCGYKDATEPEHPEELLRLVEDTLRVTNGLEFHGVIPSPANNYQVKVDFDTVWRNRMTQSSTWINKELQRIEYNPVTKKFKPVIKDMPDIKPDGILTNGNAIVVAEVEQSNKKNIWFDFVKMMLLIGRQVATFGILLVPRNYAHRRGVWNLFDEARKYRWYLIQFAGVDAQLFSKLAIVGYTQQVFIDGSWENLDVPIMAEIKRRARDSLAR